jgi:hypothetical protein
LVVGFAVAASLPAASRLLELGSVFGASAVVVDDGRASGFGADFVAAHRVPRVSARPVRHPMCMMLRVVSVVAGVVLLAGCGSGPDAAAVRACGLLSSATASMAPADFEAASDVAPEDLERPLGLAAFQVLGHQVSATAITATERGVAVQAAVSACIEAGVDM